jgi:hypothetical protein
VRFRIERFASVAAGEARLDALLDQGQVVGLQTSVYWLPYFPEDMRFHFNAHNLVVYGREGDEYLISDPVGEHPVRCHRDDLNRARFAKGMLAPKGTLYFPVDVPGRDIQPKAIRQAIHRVAWSMLAPLPIFGAGGIKGLARSLPRLDRTRPDSLRLVGHIVRMQEEIGTGGAGFRFLYAAFLQEAAQPAERPALGEFAERLMDIGDAWRAFALAAARMVKGRDPFDPPALAEHLLPWRRPRRASSPSSRLRCPDAAGPRAPLSLSGGGGAGPRGFQPGSPTWRDSRSPRAQRGRQVHLGGPPGGLAPSRWRGDSG